MEHIEDGSASPSSSELPSPMETDEEEDFVHHGASQMPERLEELADGDNDAREIVGVPVQNHAIRGRVGVRVRGGLRGAAGRGRGRGRGGLRVAAGRGRGRGQQAVVAPEAGQRLNRRARGVGRGQEANGHVPRYRRQQHSEKWQREHPEWNIWLTESATFPNRSYCRACEKDLSPHLANLNYHSLTSKHLQNVNELQEALQAAPDNANARNNIREEVKKLEIRTAAMYAENSYSFLSVVKLNAILHSISDSAIAQGVKLSPSKIKIIISKILYPTIHEDLKGKLTRQKFSILIDESTDCSTNSAICICTRYFDEGLGKVVTSLWDFVEIYDDTDRRATGEDLYNLIRDSFANAEIPIQNVVGFASDGANNVSGIRNSVASRMQRDLPGIFIIKCLSHSIHLVACKAVNELPHEIEAVCSATFAYFSKSSLRQQGLIRCQVAVNGEVRKMLKPSQTRWLSFKACISRMLENIENRALVRFFENAADDGDLVAATIRDFIKDPIKLAYLHFLDYILRQITSINIFFQHEKVVVPELGEKCNSFYAFFLRRFIKPAAITENI